MRIVALLTVRNEALYLRRCLEHLFQQGIETCVIDNESTDDSRRIAEEFVGKGVFRVETLPYRGFFELEAQCIQQELLSQEIEADWFIHHDADEIRQAPAGYRSLHTGIEAVDLAGFNAIDFAEYVFFPTSQYENHENSDYVRTMKHYYYFEPSPLHRVNAWKKTHAKIDMNSSGGHNIQFEDRRIWPEQFILRHYIALSAAHARSKYGLRTYSAAEVENHGWHGWRANFADTTISFSRTNEMKPLSANGVWEKTDPKKRHIFIIAKMDSAA